MAEKQLRLRVVLDMVDKALAPLKRIGEGSGETARAIKAAKEQLKAMGDTQKAVGDFRQARTGLDDLQAKLGAAREKARTLAQVYAQTGPPTKAMHDAMAKVRAEVNQAGAAFNAQQQRVQQLRDKLSAAGISTKNLSEHERKLRADIAATTASITKQTDALKLQASHQRRAATVKTAQQANVAARGDARGALFDGAAMAATLGAPIKMAVDFESSMADVDKVMDFGDDKNGLAKMSKSAVELSKRLPMAAKDIAQIMALGGQSGLGANEILGANGGIGFAEHAIKMGTAFGMTAEESGNAMAKMKSAFGMGIPEVAALTDKINLLGNTGAANEKQILNIVTRVGPLAGVAGTATGELAALASTLAGMGVQEEIAATGIKNMMLAMVAGENASKSQRAGFKKLGLDSTAVAKSMQKDATGAMVDLMERVKKLDKFEQASALQSIFQKESILAIAPLLTQLDTLKENFQKVGDSTRYAGAVEKEYAARAATTANRLQLTKNQAAAVGIVLGNVMLPALNDALSALMPWLNQLSNLTQAFPGVTKALVMGIGALVLFKIAAIAGVYVMTFIKGALLATQGALLAVRAGWMLHTGAMIAGTNAGRAAVVISKALTVAQWLWNAALAANPIGIVLIAIVALVAAGVLLYRNWANVVAGGKALWSDFKTWISALWGDIVGSAIALWNDLATWLPKLWNSIIGAAQTAWGSLTGWLSAQWSAIAAGAQAAWGGLTSWLTALWGSIVNGAQAAWGSLTSWLSALWASITGTAAMAWQALLAGVDTLWTSLAQTIMTLGVQLPQQFANLGGFLVDGIIGGITGKLGALRDAVVGAATSAARWFKEKLGIASPSKVFTQFGGWISEGAANGIDAGQAGVRAAALAMAGAAMVPVGAAQAGDIGADTAAGPAAMAPMAAMAALAPRASAGGAGAAGGISNISITIQAAPGMDERALAKLVAQELERIERRRSFQTRSSLQDLD